MLPWTWQCRSVFESLISIPLDPGPEVRFLVQMAPVLFLEVGWNHWLDGYESEQTLGDSRVGSLMCYIQSLGSQRIGHDWATEPQQYYIVYLNICCKKRKINKAGGNFCRWHIYGIGCVAMASQLCLQPLQFVYIKCIQVLTGQSYFKKETFLKVTRFIQTLHKRRHMPYSVSCVMC